MSVLVAIMLLCINFPWLLVMKVSVKSYRSASLPEIFVLVTKSEWEYIDRVALLVSTAQKAGIMYA
jgi:hypothetical protein